MYHGSTLDKILSYLFLPDIILLLDIVPNSLQCDLIGPQVTVVLQFIKKIKNMATGGARGREGQCCTN